MNITFSWRFDFDRYDPICKSDILNDDGISLLDCILMDSGGLRYSETNPWLNAGINKIISVVSGELDSAEWIRETWGVYLKNGEAKIYSLHSEDYFQIISINSFLLVMQEWRGFLLSRPDLSHTRTISLQ